MNLLTLNEDKDRSSNDRNEIKGQVHEIPILQLGKPIRYRTQSRIPDKCLGSKFLERRLEEFSKLKRVRHIAR